MPRPKALKLESLVLSVIILSLVTVDLYAQNQSTAKVVRKIDNQTFSIYEPQMDFANNGVASKSAPRSRTTSASPLILSTSERDQIKQKATNFFARNSEHFKIKNGNQLKLLGIRKDTNERSSAVFQQTVNDIPIFGAYTRTLSNAQRSNEVYYSTGHNFDLTNMSINTTPNISLNDAQNIAIDYLLTKFNLSALKQSLKDPKQRTTLLSMFPATLYLLNESLLRGRISNKASDFKLVYLVEANISFDISGVVKVDAITGEVIDFTENKQAASKNIISDCSTGCTCPIVINGASATPIPNASTDAIKAHDLFEAANNYFMSEFGQNGANGLGGIGDGLLTKLDENRAFTNYNGCNSATCAYGGAWFSYSPRALNFCAGSISHDVFFHELFHAFNASNIVYSSAGTSAVLLNQYESGAANESFADLFGEDFASFDDPSRLDWVFGTNSNIQAKRSFSLPSHYRYRVAATNKTHPYPDRYTSDSFYCGAENNGGVHWNSTVFSNAAFLASVGTSGLNLPGNKFNGCEITGIGLYKVVQILYHTIVNATARISNFNELYAAVDMGCALLVNDPANIYRVSTSDCFQVRRAMQAVELDFPTYGQCKPDRYVPTCADNPIPGDCNFDGYVNERDKVVWSLNYGKVSPAGTNFKLACDLDLNGRVDAADYTKFRDINGFIPAPVSSPVPVH